MSVISTFLKLKIKICNCIKKFQLQDTDDEEETEENKIIDPGNDATNLCKFYYIFTSFL